MTEREARFSAAGWNREAPSKRFRGPRMPAFYQIVVAALLASSLAFAEGDAPKAAPLVPMSHDEAVACLTCDADLKDANAALAKWVGITAVAGVVLGVVIGGTFGCSQTANFCGLKR